MFLEEPKMRIRRRWCLVLIFLSKILEFIVELEGMACKWNGRRSGALMPLALLLFALSAGCGRVPTGGDIPLTRERLESTRLTDINRKLTWTFFNATVVIDNEDQPLPADIVELLQLQPVPAVRRVEATWELDEQAGFLQLSQITADGAAVDHPLQLPITPAGPIRVNLAGRQYNRFADLVAAGDAR